MLTDADLIAIGRLAVAYADLDFFVTLCAALLLRCADMKIGWGLIVSLEFSRKCDKVKELLEYHNSEHAVFDENRLAEVKQLFSAAKAAGSSRNDIMHSHIDFRSGERPVFRHARTARVIDARPETIGPLCEEMARLEEACYHAVDTFLYVLDRRATGRDRPT